MNDKRINQKLFLIEISFYSILIIIFSIFLIYNNVSLILSNIIYISFILISFSYLFSLEFIFKKYDNAFHFKMFEKYYIPVNNIKRINKKRKGLLYIIIIWIIYLSIIWFIKYIGYLSWQLFLIGACIVFIFNSIFTRKLCLLSVLFLHNENNCCKNCTINSWDNAIFASSLFFAPKLSIVATIINILIIVISFSMLVLWEYNYYKYPYRFYSKTNAKLNCSNCLKKCKYEKGNT